ncbi:hypothetical protein J2T55_002576 [Methylohalomonas lacus]|uniref:Uncharacterized protein n=1 Tax=Methylohalomonas lacus TaxID=398773 RepID=A0AAE3HNI1_9GAMM|nr:hypothetical protein [Methylohalomonas lacus]
MQLAQGGDDVFQRGALAVQCLRLLRIVPDVGFGQFALDLGQTFGLAVVVKDTP